MTPQQLADLAERYWRDGFVHAQGLIPLEDLEALIPAVDEAVAKRKAHDTRTLDEKTPYEQSFIQCQYLWEDFPGVRGLTFHQKLGEALGALLGAEKVRLWHDQALYKETGGRATDAHQDQPYWPITEPDTITAWVPFDGSTLANGAMAYVPGSHQVGLRKFVNIFFGEPEDLLGHPDIAGTEPRFVEVPRGAVAFHHGLTAHLAGPNDTDRVRRVHTMIYFADGCTRGGASHPHFAVDRGGIEDGAPIVSDVTPVAWPRPDGDLPPTPADHRSDPTAADPEA